MLDILIALGLCLLGYLIGSISFALLLTRLVKGVDVRDAGSQHASATNTFRQVGVFAGILVALLDIAKGFIPTYLAVQFSPYEWGIPVAAAFAVAGHCWPLFSNFRGGMGLATSVGAILAVYPFGILIFGFVLISLTLLLKHSAKASLITGLITAPIFWLLGQRGIVFWLVLAVGLVLVISFSRDWARVYRELWLDRE